MYIYIYICVCVCVYVYMFDEDTQEKCVPENSQQKEMQTVCLL
jgi:hypothetical protein